MEEEEREDKDLISTAREVIKERDIERLKTLLSKISTATIKSSFLVHTACEAGLIPAVEHLLSGDLATLEDRDSNGNTPLHIACQCGHVQLIDTFITQFNITSLNNEGQSLIHIATNSTQLEVIQLLVSKGFSPDTYTGTDGLNCLHLACKQGHMSIVRYLLHECKMNPKVTTRPTETKPGGQQPVHFAALHGHLELLMYLVEEKGCDPNAEDGSGKTPTLLAGESGKIEVMKYLVEDKKCDSSHLAKGSGKVAAKRQAIHGAAFVGHLEMVQYLIVSCNIDPHAKDSSGVTPIACASQEGKIEVVKYLSQSANIDINVQDSSGRTPLHYACLKGREEVVKYLCSVVSIDVDLLDNSAETATIIACKNSHLNVVSYLVMEGKCSIEISVSSGRRIIDYASAKNWIELVMYLVEELHCNPEGFNELRLSPLHYAAEGNALSVLKYYLEERKCDPNLMSKEKDAATTPLLRAAMFGSFEVVQYLVKERMCSLSIASQNKLMTPLHLACSGGHKELVIFLIESCRHELEPLNSQSAIPLHMAILNKHLDITRYLIEVHHSSPLKTTKGGATGIHAACQGGSLEILEYLLSLPQLKEFKDLLYFAPGGSPLDQAAEQGHLDIVCHLVLNNICDPLKRGDNGYTSLHWSAYKGKTDVVKFLLQETSCDLTSANANGQTPLHLACSRIDREHIDTVKCLLEHKDKRQLSCKDGNKMTPLQIVKNSKIYSNEGRELKRESEEGQMLVTELITLFIMAGADPEHVLQVEPNKCNFMKSAIPLYSHTKVFLLGNSKVLANELNTLEGSSNDEMTTSIPPIHVTYRDYRHINNMLVYQLSSSVTSLKGVLTDAIKSCQSPVFVLCIDIGRDYEDIGTQLNTWLQFTQSLLVQSTVHHTPMLVICLNITNEYTDVSIIDQVTTHCLSLSIETRSLIGDTSHVIFCDEKYPNGGAAKLILLLSRYYNALQSSHSLELFPIAMRSLLLSLYNTNGLLSITLEDLSCYIIAHEIPLPSDLTILSKALITLNQSGHVLYIRHDKNDIGASIIMPDPKLVLMKLFETVNELLTCPNSPHLTTEENILSICHDCALQPEDFIKLLYYMEVCIEIKEHVIIPSLLPCKPTNELSICTDHRICVGWLLECDPTHTLSLPLCNSLPFIAANLLPALPMNGSCTIWRGGAQLTHGTLQITLSHLQNEAILLVMKDLRKCLFSTAKMRSSIIKEILNLKALYCPNVSTQSYLLHPSCTANMTFKTPEDPSLAAISIQDILETLGQTEKAFNCSCEDLAGFEPLFILGLNFRAKFFNKENSNGIITPEDQQCIVKAFTHYCQELAVMLREELSPVYNSDHERTHSVFNEWMSKGKDSLRSYSELWDCMEEYSMFSLHNPPPSD